MAVESLNLVEQLTDEGRMVWLKEEKIVIEDMKEDDLLEVLAIEQASFSDPWTYNMFMAEFSNPFSHLWVARDISGALTGYICSWLIEDEAHVLNLAVHPLYRRKGLGSLLISGSLESWKNAGIRLSFLEVRESNSSARSLYEKFGFRIMMRRPQYYKNPKEDACVMVLEL